MPKTTPSKKTKKVIKGLKNKLGMLDKLEAAHSDMQRGDMKKVNRMLAALKGRV